MKVPTNQAYTTAMIDASVGVNLPLKIPNRIITTIRSAKNASLTDLNNSRTLHLIPLGCL